MMKQLLENDMPLHYKVGRRRTAIEIQIADAQFDLIDSSTNFVVQISMGDVSFVNRGLLLSVINYEGYLNQFDGTQMSDGKRRCDFILTDKNNAELVLLCELSSSIGDTQDLKIPIHGRKKNGVVVGAFSGGKYEKVESQLSGTLDTIMQVPTISLYIKGEARKVCLMAYVINPREDETFSTIKAFNRPLQMESEEAGENGAQVPCKAIERYGFQYYRISHKYKFQL